MNRALRILSGLILALVLGPFVALATSALVKGGSAGTSATPSYTSVTATTVNGTTGNFTFIDAGTILITGGVTPLTFGSSSTENTIMSMTEDSTTSTTVGALALKCGSNIAATDLCVVFRDSAGTLIGYLAENGKLAVGGAADTDSVGVLLNRRNFIVLNGSSGSTLISDDGSGDMSLQAIGTDVLFTLAYPRLTHNAAGAPTATDCDAAGEAGRITGNNAAGTLHLCKGTGGWSTSAPVESVQGFTGTTLNTEEQAFAVVSAGHTGTGFGNLHFVVSAAGVAGAGSAVLEVMDGVTQRCTVTFACNAAAGTHASAACTGTFTAGNTVGFQWDTSSGCTTLPIGSASVSWQ